MACRHSCVLSIGSDPAVFDSRNRVLEVAGFEVVPCFRSAGALTTFASRHVDAVLLGDCSESSRLNLLREFRRINPHIPVVVIYPVGERTADVELADAAMESLQGPECLIRTVFSVIRKKPDVAHPGDAQAAPFVG